MVSSGVDSVDPATDGEGEVLILKSTMPPKVAAQAIEIILQARALTVEKDAATQIKRELDRVNGETWHCIIGKDFGVSLCFDAKFLLFAKLQNSHYLIFKSFDMDKALAATSQ